MPLFLLTATPGYKQLKAVIILFLLFLATSVSAQITLSGEVKDLNNNPIPGVNILITGRGKGAITDDEGKFRFSNLRKGAITLQCSHVSYLTLNKGIDLLKQDRIIIILYPTTKKMGEVVLTSNGSELTRNSPYSVNTLSHADLQKSGQNTLIETLSQIGRAHV